MAGTGISAQTMKQMMQDPDLDKPPTLPSASERLDMSPASGKGAAETRMSQAERDAEIKRQKAEADAAYQAYKNRGKK